MTDFDVTEVGAVDAAYERGLREAAQVVSNRKTVLEVGDELERRILALIPDAQEDEE